jgi:hypothetical protein
VHVTNLVSLLNFCPPCENQDESDKDHVECGKGKDASWNDSVGDEVSYLLQQKSRINKFVTIAHNANTFNLYFIFNRAILLNWQQELVMKGLKMVCMRVQNIKLLE